MFGKRSNSGPDPRGPAAAAPAAPPPEPARAPAAAMGGSDVGLAPMPSSGLGAPITSPPLAPGSGPKPIIPTARDNRRSESYYEVKGAIFSALIEAIDLSQLARLDAESAREEIRDIVNEIIAIKSIVMSIAEQEELLDDICNDVLGYGPLEPLLARDDIADIMVNGANTVYIEVDGKIQQTNIRFRDNQQLLNICAAHRQPDRPPRRRSLADLRRAPAGWLARQRHRAAARDRRAFAHHPQIQEGQAARSTSSSSSARSRPRAPKS